MKILKLYILSLPLLWLWSCSAPHDNPLDPSSPNYVEPTPPVVVPPDPVFFTSVRSVHKDYPSTDTYSVIADVWPEENLIIDSATVQYLNTTPRGCAFRSNTGHWTYTFIPNNFGSDYPDIAVGQPFYFRVYTRYDSIWDVGPAYFLRVLDDTPLIVSPVNGVAEGPYPVFNWQNYDANFPYYYKIQLERYDRSTARLDTVWTSDSLGANTTSVTVPDSLSDTVPNETPDLLYYQWMVVAYDNFGNSAISIEAVFNVDAGIER